MTPQSHCICRRLSMALLHKSGFERTAPFPGRTYPTGSVLSDQSVEVPRHEALAQAFDAVPPIVRKTVPRIVF